MLTINGAPVQLPGDALYITHVWGGLDTLDFDIDPRRTEYAAIAEEIQILYDDIRYTVKGINERRSVSSIHAVIDLDALRSTAHLHYNSGSVSLETLLISLLPSGWKVIDAELVPIRRTIDMDACTNYDIIMRAMATFGVCYRWDNVAYVLTVIKPDNIQPSGVYLTDQLNLQELSFKGSTDDFCTRLYPYGVIDETSGLPLTIASVNGGAEYVDNHNYSNKIIAAIWNDERYTDAQSLKDAAIEQLKILAQPVRSYECTVSDLAKSRSEYSSLKIALYDVLVLIDRTRKTRVQHRVVEYKEYPLRPDKNEVKLSSVAAKITTKIEQVKTDLTGEIEVDRNKISQVKQDADALAVRMEQTYTKGETDAKISGAVTVAADSIRSEVSKTYVTSGQLESTTADLEAKIDTECAVTLRIDSSRGTVFKNNAVSTVLSAVIYKGSERITDAAALHRVFGAAAYLEWSWQRLDETRFGVISSSDSRLSNGGFNLTLAAADVDTKVTFMCSLNV